MSFEKPKTATGSSLGPPLGKIPQASTGGKKPEEIGEQDGDSADSLDAIDDKIRRLENVLMKNIGDEGERDVEPESKFDSQSPDLEDEPDPNKPMPEEHEGDQEADANDEEEAQPSNEEEGSPTSDHQKESTAMIKLTPKYTANVYSPSYLQNVAESKKSRSSKAAKSRLRSHTAHHEDNLPSHHEHDEMEDQPFRSSSEQEQAEEENQGFNEMIREQYIKLREEIKLL